MSVTSHSRVTMQMMKPPWKQVIQGWQRNVVADKGTFADGVDRCPALLRLFGRLMCGHEYNPPIRAVNWPIL
jgi:hypothetical protein